MRITHGKLVYILAEHNEPLVYQYLKISDHVWSIFYYLKAARTHLLQNTKESEGQARLFLGIAILKGSAFLEAAKVDPARFTTSPKRFPRFGNVSEYMHEIEAPLAQAYLGAQNEAELKICFEVFVVLATTFLEELVPDGAEVEAVLSMASKLIKTGNSF